jgi:hypothetical protein
VATTAALLPLATHALLPRHWWWRRKKGLVSENSFADGLLFEIVSSLGYFCLNRLGAMASVPTHLGDRSDLN